MDTQRYMRRILVAFVLVGSLVLSGCEEAATSDDGGGGGGSGTVTFEDGDSWRLIGLGIDDFSTWFSVIDSTVNGAAIDITMTAISDQSPPSGTTDTIDYTVNSAREITFASGATEGYLNSLGTTFVSRGSDLDDDEGELMVGVRNGSAMSESSVNGAYWVAVVIADADIDGGPVYFTGSMDDDIVSPGLFVTSNPVSDYEMVYITDPDTMEYEITVDGVYTMPESAEITGIVREDGEFFSVAEINGTPAAPDNSYKALMYGVQLSDNASGDLLEGTWGICSSCVGDASDSWYEGGEEMTLDSTGAGTIVLNDGSEAPVAVALNSDGTFTFTYDVDPFEMHGAVTPSGDTAIIVSPQAHPVEDEYCISIAVKKP
jgi:hypothetical protein